MQDFTKQLERIIPVSMTGTIVSTTGTSASVADLRAPVGALVEIERTGEAPLPAEVIGFRDDLTLVYPLASMTGVRNGHRARLRRTARWIRVGEALLGRVMNAEGDCIDGRPQPHLPHRIERQAPAPAPLDRPRITAALGTGIRAIDGLLTCGKGQRMGIFSGSGVGKSVLLGMMAKFTSADLNVIALIGERGREVNDFLERDLGPEGLSRSVVIVATSDEPAVVRIQAAQTATAVAEHFRAQGCNVLFLMDSITRCAMAQREVGLAAGEPPTTRGYTPSVFAMLPRLVERTGCTRQGSITAFYSVLVEGDDPNEPISDAVRGLLDGHVWLSRELAARGHYPAIDVLGSISRLMPDITNKQQQQAGRIVRSHLAALRDHEDLISIGAYRAGSNREVDSGLALKEEMDAFLRQRIGEATKLEAARDGLIGLSARLQSYREQTAVVQPQAAAPAS